MNKEKLPIIAHGELYVEPIIKKNSGGPKSMPREYLEAKANMLSNIDTLFEEINSQKEIFMKEKVVCVRMEPKFEAKSYVPDSVFQVSDEMEIIGGRKYKIKEESEELTAKLYFLRTTNQVYLSTEN